MVYTMLIYIRVYRGGYYFARLGGVPTMNEDDSISVDMTTLNGVSTEAKDFISKLLQRECRYA